MVFGFLGMDIITEEAQPMDMVIRIILMALKYSEIHTDTLLTYVIDKAVIISHGSIILTLTVTPWNNPALYYPEDNYIDWIGVSTYGPFQRGDDYIKPKELINKAYQKMQGVSTNKPYAILEFGVTEL